MYKDPEEVIRTIIKQIKDIKEWLKNYRFILSGKKIYHFGILLFILVFVVANALLFLPMSQNDGNTNQIIFVLLLIELASIALIIGSLIYEFEFLSYWKKTIIVGVCILLIGCLFIITSTMTYSYYPTTAVSLRYGGAVEVTPLQPPLLISLIAAVTKITGLLIILISVNISQQKMYLLKFLTNDDWDIRANAGWTLGRHALDDILEKNNSELLEKLLKKQDKGVNVGLSVAVGECTWGNGLMENRVLETLINFLNHNDSRIREATAFIIAQNAEKKLTDERTLNPLLNLLTDDNPTVCINAIFALGAYAKRGIKQEYLTQKLLDAIKTLKMTQANP